ncbi:MAG: rluB [Patescibacteria group bacterium]|nr:rluB [Patescibacteria group bacterium]
MKDQSTLEKGLIRLEKFIAQEGLCSRREGKQLILDGKISVNGKIVRETGFGVDPKTDKVAIVGKIEKKTTVVLYKPRGIETSKTSEDSVDIHDEFPALATLSPVGRLDKDSEGLILLTNDGLVTRAITGENSEVEKEYIVTTREPVTDEAIEKMAKGIVLDGKKTLPAKTKRLNDTVFSIILREGRKHQIRRMADACRLTIEELKRIRIGSIKVGNMKSGDVRELSEKEVNAFKS